MLCDGTGRAAGFGNGHGMVSPRGGAGRSHGGLQHGMAGKLSEAYAHYRKAADGNDDSAWWALGRFYENGVVVAQDGKEARRCYETGEKLGSVKCKMRLARCKLLGIGGRREKKAGLDLCRQALELAKESSEKEDYGYEAEMNLLRRTIAENES